jgi:hypothetical protein
MAVQYNPRIPISGLVLGIDAANRKSYVGSGTTWTDIINSGIGSLTSGPTYNSSNQGSIAFDGTNDFVSFPNNTLLDPGTGSFSIVTWVNTSPLNTTTTEYWVSKRSTSTNGYYMGGSVSLGARLTMGNNASTRIDTGYVGYSSNTWTMFSGILDISANTQKIIRNSHEQTQTGTPAGGTYSTAVDLSIGGISSFFMNGKISYLLIYQKALTNAEVTQIYNSTKGRYGL